MKALSLRTSLTLAYTGMLALLVSGLSFGYHRLLVRQLDAEWTVVLGDLTRGLHGYLRFKDGRALLEYNKSDPEAVAFIEDATRYYRVYDANTRRLLVQSPALDSLGLRHAPDEISAFIRSPGVQDFRTDRGRLRLQSSLVSPSPGERYLLQVGEPLDRFDRAIAGFERLLIWRILAGLGVAALVGYWMAGRALAPLSRLARATRAIDITNLQQRVPVRGADDELDEVARALNHSLARVEHAVAEMRQFSAALAHELRTPLAILRGESELALKRGLSPDELRQTLTVQLEEFDRLARLINQILTLARAEAGEISLSKQPVDLAALSVSVVEQLETVAEARGVHLACDAPSPLRATGDAGWLERLLLILLDNAIKFTPSGGRVLVRLSPEQAVARLDVRDEGPGIEPESVPHIFEPFYRADPGRSARSDGAGLGLALAKWIVGHHRGTIEVTSRPGDGSTFTVRLPLRAAGQDEPPTASRPNSPSS